MLKKLKKSSIFYPWLKAKSSKLKASQGFTLVELIVYTGISAVVLTAIAGYSWNILNLGVRVDVREELTQNGRLAMDRITQKIHAADTVVDYDSAGNQRDDALAQFSLGTFFRTQWDNVNQWLELSSDGQTLGSGTFTSRVMTAASPIAWGPMAWTPQMPSGKELPGGALLETQYPSGNAAMTGNVLLLHLNESNGILADASGNANDATNHGATYGVAGRYKTALDFTGSPPANQITLTPLADTWIVQGSNYLNRGNDPKLWIYSVFHNFVLDHALLWFDLSSIPIGSPITSALLRLKESMTLGPSGTLEAHRITRSWTEGSNQNYSGATWSTYDGSHLWTTPGGDYDPTATASTQVSTWNPSQGPQTYEWNVASDVQDFVNGTKTNYGWLLKPNVSPDSWFLTLLHSREGSSNNRPKLVVSYGAGAGAYAEVNHHASLMPTQLTAEAWVKLDTLPGANQWYGLVSKGDEFSQDGYELLVRASNAATAPNRIAWSLGGTMVYSTAAPTPSKWIHVAGTFDGTTAKLYIDGVLNNTATASLTPNTRPVYLGRRFTNSSHVLDGKLDEVAIYNRALSGQEILDRYRRGVLNVRFQVRNSASNPPTGSFIGPDGTTATYYSELNNATITPPSFSLTNLPVNPYFQYKAFLDTEDSTLNPEVLRVVLGDGSNFGVHPSVLALDFPGSNTDVAIDTYLKDIALGYENVQIRKLRLKEGLNTPVDLTSDRVNVTRFVVYNRTRFNEPKTVKIELTLEYIGSKQDFARVRSASFQTSVAVRKR